jgi:hypothetical protein
MKAITIVTNSSMRFKSEDRELFTSPKLVFILPFHPEYASLKEFHAKVTALKDDGFKVACVTLVFTPDKMSLYRQAVDLFAESGIKVNPNPDTWYAKRGRDEDKRRQTADLLKDHIHEFDLRHKTGTAVTAGKLCRAPMISVSMKPDGAISNSCLKTKQQNLFWEDFNATDLLSEQPPRCPKLTCNCPHKYSFLCDSDDRFSDTLSIYERYADVALLER